MYVLYNINYLDVETSRRDVSTSKQKNKVLTGSNPNFILESIL